MTAPEPLDPFEEPEDEAQPIVANDVDADRLLRRINRLDREADRVRHIVAVHRAHLAVWLEGQLETLGAKREWLWRSLEGWTRVACTERRVRSIALPAGRVGLRTGRSRVEAWREPEAIEREHPYLVRVKTEVDRSAVGQMCQVGPVVDDPIICGEVDIPDGYYLHYAVNDHGELIEGVGFLVPSEDRFYAQAVVDDD